MLGRRRQRHPITGLPIKRAANQYACRVIGALAGTAPASGIVSNTRQLSRSLVSAALQLGKQIEGSGV